MEEVITLEEHSARVTSLAVHPTQPYVLSSSDDHLIRLWDWEKGWECTRTFQGHSDSVAQVMFNPEDTNSFASVSLDCKVKIWTLDSPDPDDMLDGHSDDLTCIDYSVSGDRRYLLTGSKDRTTQMWDLGRKKCIRNLGKHRNHVTAICWQPALPIITTGSLDGLFARGTQLHTGFGIGIDGRSELEMVTRSKLEASSSSSAAAASSCDARSLAGGRSRCSRHSAPRDREAEIEELCRAHVHDFIRAVDDLRSLLAEANALKGSLSSSHSALLSCAAPLLASLESYLAARALAGNLTSALTSSLRCVRLLALAARANDHLHTGPEPLPLPTLRSIVSIDLR